MNNKSSYISDAWYSLPGPDNDVIMSSRIRLARNLANFTFPQNLKEEDSQRVQSLVFDAFNKLSDNDAYQSLLFSDLDPLGQKILNERGVVNSDSVLQSSAGVILRSDGKISCCVNCDDHYRLSSFLSGFDLSSAYKQLNEIDLNLQNNLQVAGDADFGYFTSSFNDLGSGMKLSLLVHLPSISISGILERVFKEVMSQGYNITGYYGSGNEIGTSLGYMYLISSSSSFCGNEVEQINGISTLAKKLIDFERKTRKEFADNKPTHIRNSVYRAVATIKYCRFIESREGIDLISKIKWGVDLGLVQGIDDSILFALLYRIQDAHLSYVIRTSVLTYEKDVDTDELKIERLRALILQETLTGIQITA